MKAAIAEETAPEGDGQGPDLALSLNRVGAVAAGACRGDGLGLSQAVTGVPGLSQPVRQLAPTIHFSPSCSGAAFH